jgi:imidazole glycerol-phosphate synthase subunit HisH
MITLIDYGNNNTGKIASAVEELNYKFQITGSESAISKADKIILPSVPEISSAVKQLHLLNLFSLLRMIKQPLLCLSAGMQLLAESTEDGNVACLGIIPFTAEKINDYNYETGWHSVSKIAGSELFNGIVEDEKFFFENSYYIPVNEFTTSVIKGKIFSASVEKDNFYGVHFSPEKSGAAGLKLLKNFIEL